MQSARLLLAYGADPDQRAVNGMRARRIHNDNEDLRLLLKAHDEAGAMAFEDPPATWHVVRSNGTGTFGPQGMFPPTQSGPLRGPYCL